MIRILHHIPTCLTIVGTAGKFSHPHQPLPWGFCETGAPLIRICTMHQHQKNIFKHSTIISADAAAIYLLRLSCSYVYWHGSGGLTSKNKVGLLPGSSEAAATFEIQV